MVFWDDDAQRQTALNVFEIGLIGVAGYGVFRALGSLARVLTRRQNLD